MSAKVVIGANFGDESKGSLVDYFFSTMDNKSPALNIRFNGGAQAGHTVNKSRCQHHVFHHFGAGSFNNFVETYLSEDFVCNPLMFVKELKELQEKGVFPRIYVNSNAIVTTPYDMMINQIVEESRGENRHGSCGLGINETIVRHEQAYNTPVWRLFVADDKVRLRLDNIRNHVPVRLKQLGVALTDEWKERVYSDSIMDAFIESCETFKHVAHIVYDQSNFIQKYDPDRIVFEGAQGLLLDQDHKWFPHVTRSSTGVKNVVKIASEAGLTDLDVSYITRAYMTRHGAGPFPTEVPGMSFEDKTNVPNDWQGTLRFGMLDVDLLAESIKNDLATNLTDVKITHGVAVTCLDQVSDGVDFVVNGAVVKNGSPNEILSAIRSKGLGIFYTKYGKCSAFMEAKQLVEP